MRALFVAPFICEGDEEREDAASGVGDAAGASEPLHFKDLFKVAVAGPALWSAMHRLAWDRVFATGSTVRC